MTNMQKIANLLTVCNLLSGITTIVFIYANKPYYGLLFVVIAAIFDLMGGPISRYEYIRSSSIKKINNNGILFDSLIDTVSFGLAPSLLIVYNIYTVLGITLAIFYFLSVIYRLTKFTVKLYELELEHKNKIVKTKRITGLPIQFAAIIVFLIFIASPYNYINMFLILGTTLLMHSSFKINKPHY
jgi:CDP-diacylglycerol--serine O-phosphatidyltransferase